LGSVKNDIWEKIINSKFLFQRYGMRRIIMYCNNCGQPVPNGSKFCNNCGAKIMIMEETSQEEIALQAEIEKNLSQEVEKLIFQNGQENNADNDSSIIIPILSLGNESLCDKCGSLLDEHFTYCINCGNKLDKSGKEATTNIIKPKRMANIKLSRTISIAIFLMLNVWGLFNIDTQIFFSAEGWKSTILPHFFVYFIISLIIYMITIFIVDILLKDEGIHCINCRYPLPKGARFCSNCGISVMVEEEIEDNVEKAVQNNSENIFDENHNGFILDSPNPLDDGLRKYNFIYYIFFISGALCSFTIKGDRYGLFFFFGLLGILVAWVIKTIIANIKIHKLRQIQFDIPSNTSNSYLYDIASLELSKYGMFVEMSAHGLCITHNGIIYDLNLNDNSTFSLWWRLTMAKALLSGRTYIGLYRKAVVSMGLIAYIIQQKIGQNNNNINETKNSNLNQKAEIKNSSTDTKVIIGIFAIILIGLSFVYINNEDEEAINTPAEDVELYNQIHGTDYDVYDYIRRDNWWNKLFGIYSEEKERDEKQNYYLKQSMERSKATFTETYLPKDAIDNYLNNEERNKILYNQFLKSAPKLSISPDPTVSPTPEPKQPSKLEKKYQYYDETSCNQNGIAIPGDDIENIEELLSNSPYYRTWYDCYNPDIKIIIDEYNRNDRPYGIKNAVIDSEVGTIFYFYLDEPDSVYVDNFYREGDNYFYTLSDVFADYASITSDEYLDYIYNNPSDGMKYGNDPAFYEDDYYNPYTLDDIYSYAVDYASDAIVNDLNLSQVDLLYGGFYPDRKSDMYFEYDGNYTYYLTFEIYYHYFANYYYYRAEFTFTDKDKNHKLVMRNVSVERK
jgi:predicted amidophosphoribosyltransferase